MLSAKKVGMELGKLVLAWWWELCSVFEKGFGVERTYLWLS